MQLQIRQILNHYGVENQKKKAIEELSELIRAITRDDLKNIIEEIADVEIMISQLKMLYFIEDEEILNVKKEKLAKVLFEINNRSLRK